MNFLQETTIQNKLSWKKTQVNSITHPPDLENLRYASGSPLVLPYGLIINIQNMFIEYL